MGVAASGAKLLEMSGTGGLPLTAPPPLFETDFDTSLRSDQDFSPRQRGPSPEAERTPANTQEGSAASSSQSNSWTSKIYEAAYNAAYKQALDEEGVPPEGPPEEPSADTHAPTQAQPIAAAAAVEHQSQRNKISQKSFGSVKEPIHPRSIWKPEDKDAVLEATSCLCHVRCRWGVNLLNAMQFPTGAFQ